MSTDTRTIELHRERMASAQRYELVGHLAGPVTHDINNALGVIVMYADLLRTQFEEGSDTREDLDEIFEAAQRAAHLSKWLNSYSSRTPDQVPTGISLASTLAALQKIAGKYAAFHGVELEFALEPTPMIELPQTETEDLLLALIADMCWSLTSGRVRLVTSSDVGHVVMTLTGEGELTDLGGLPDFTFLAPGPGDAGSPETHALLRDRATRLGGSLEREQAEGRLMYRLQLPLGRAP